MASDNNIIRLADFPRSKDSAVAALERMRSADTDSQYESARAAFVAAKPCTLAGIRAKHEALGVMLENVREGEELSPAGWEELFAIFGAVSAALTTMTARVA
jgi:hypothetical protein